VIPQWVFFRQTRNYNSSRVQISVNGVGWGLEGLWEKSYIIYNKWTVQGWSEDGPEQLFLKYIRCEKKKDSLTKNR
jgi:hypothetical protein